ncbi:MAG: site-2 protease family protein [Candidatus Dependentiae bacterium]|nr:site-2 protease family protein [Candidatus Dependentiae bacterium]
MKASAWYRWIIGIAGLSVVIIAHEMGHFAACKLFHVGTPLFSIGFGPRIAAFTLKSTTFQLAALPLGGYVSIDQVSFNAQSYLVKMIIMIAGIIFNFLFALIAFMYLMYGSRSRVEYGTLIAEDFVIQPDAPFSRLKTLQHVSARLFAKEGSTGLIGPIGIISLAGKSLAYGADLFIFTLALLSINIGIFNLLPIPGLDGSQLLALTIEKIVGPLAGSDEWMHMLFFILFILFMLLITLKDVKKIKHTDQ